MPRHFTFLVGATMSHEAALMIQAVGAAATSAGAILLAEGPAVVERPTPVVVGIIVGVASLFAPGLIREGGEYLRRKQEREAIVEDRQVQQQLDAITARAAAAEAKARTAEEQAARARKHVEVLKAQVRDLEAARQGDRRDIDANASGVRIALAGAGAAKGLAEAGLEAGRKGDLLPAPPPETCVPGTDWPRVLLVDDDPASNYVFCRELPGRYGFRVAAVTTLREGLVALADLDPAYVFLDLNLPDGSGEVIARRCREEGRRARIFVITGDGDPATRDRLLALGVEAVLVRPIRLADLVGMMRLPRGSGSSAEIPTYPGPPAAPPP
jgi:CheY-like chemotaxis protein